MLMDAHKAYKSGHIDEALLKYAYLAELGYETAQSNVAFILDQGTVPCFYFISISLWLHCNKNCVCIFLHH